MHENINLLKADQFMIFIYEILNNLEEAENIKKAIDKSRIIKLDRFIYSIGNRHIGQENAKILGSFFKSIEQFSNMFKSKIA